MVVPSSLQGEEGLYRCIANILKNSSSLSHFIKSPVVSGNEGGILMSEKFYKIFKKNSLHKKIEIEMPQYLPGEDNYYALIKKYKELGYIQVIVSSDLMLFLLKHYFQIRKGKISEFTLMEDDEEFHDEVRNIIKIVNRQRDMFSILLNHLRFLRDENSIEIQKISITVPESSGPSLFINIQSNGIVEIDSPQNEYEKNEVKKQVEYFYESI